MEKFARANVAGSGNVTSCPPCATGFCVRADRLVSQMRSQRAPLRSFSLCVAWGNGRRAAHRSMILARLGRLRVVEHLVPEYRSLGAAHPATAHPSSTRASIGFCVVCAKCRTDPVCCENRRYELDSHRLVKLGQGGREQVAEWVLCAITCSEGPAQELEMMR